MKQHKIWAVKAAAFDKGWNKNKTYIEMLPDLYNIKNMAERQLIQNKMGNTLTLDEVCVSLWRKSYTELNKETAQ